MRRFWINVFAAGVLFALGWTWLHQNQISNLNDAIRLANSQFKSWDFSFAARSRPARPTLRIASFNIQTFGADKVQDPTVSNYLATIIREFDVIAIQEVRGDDVAALSTFVDRVNSAGREYAFVASDPVDRNRYSERYAFLFDRNTVSLDGSHSYTVHDPDDVLHREPFVGWFRANAVDPSRAFTFSLVDVHLDARKPEREVACLAQIFRAIRGDGRGEDDIIFAGDFNTGPDQLQSMGDPSGLTCLIADTPTDVRFTKQQDNLLINLLATTEYSGQCGVFDFLKAYNLTIEQASALSDHFPVWAEFSVIEGSGAQLTASRERINTK